MAERFVANDPQGRGLRLGPEFTALAGVARFNIVEHCRLFLTELTQKTGETADLSVMRGVGMTFLDQVPGTHRLTTISKVDEVFPAHHHRQRAAPASPNCPRTRRIRLVMAEWERNGVEGDVPRFLDRLEKVRRTGLAFDLDEHSDGISAIGFGFRDWGGTLHAISVPMPSTRFCGNERGGRGGAPGDENRGSPG